MEFNERREAFIKAFGELRDQHQCDFISFPQYVPNDKGAWDLTIAVQVVDLSEMGVKSPFIHQ